MSAHRSIFRSLSLSLLSLFLLSCLAGCPAARSYREAKQAERGDQPVSAAESYLDALDRNPEHRKATDGIARVGEAACLLLLGDAERLEAARRWAEAAGAYEGLSGFLARLKRHGRPPCTAVDVAAKGLEMHTKAAEELYQQARALHAADALEDAIRIYQQAQRHQPAYRDTDARLAHARYTLAGQRQKIGQYRMAAELYVQAAESLKRVRAPVSGGGAPGSPADAVNLTALQDAPARAGRIYQALGRWFTGKGACRQAVADLERAQPLLGAGGTIQADLGRAMACATTHLFPAPLDNRTGLEAAVPLVVELSQTVPLDIQRRGSRYLAWHSVLGLPPVGGEWVWKGVAGSPEVKAAGGATGGNVWLLTGQLSSFSWSLSPALAEPYTSTGQEDYPCESATCTRDIPITWTRVRQSVEMSARLDLFLLHPVSGQRVLPVSVSRSVGDAVDYATGAVAQVSPEATAWRMPADLAAALEARSALRPQRDLYADLAPSLSRSAADQMLALLDQPPALPDPVSLPELN